MQAIVDRAGYPTLEQATYLNQASLGLIGQPAVDAMHALLDDVARHGNLHMSDEQEASHLDGLRSRAADLLSADAARVAVVSSASDLLGQAPDLLAPPAGSTVVAVATDFPAITRPWLRWQQQGRCRVDFVADRAGHDPTADVIDRIDAGTSVVAVGWVQYATGTVFDVARLRAATRDAGVRLVVDATQGAGALPVDARAWEADLLVTSGYKWLGGHGGVAIGVVSDDLARATPAQPGWFGAADPFDFDAMTVSFAPDARRFTQSTMSYVSVAGLSVAIDQLLQVGQPALAQHARRLAEELMAAVEPLGWRPLRPLDDPAASPHIVALQPPRGTADQVAHALRADGIVCGARGGCLRVSLAPYNDATDVARLVEGLTAVA